jgi:hypothetical protein
MKTDHFTRMALVEALYEFSNGALKEHDMMPEEGRVVVLVHLLRNLDGEYLHVRLEAEMLPWDFVNDCPVPDPVKTIEPKEE